MYQMGSKFMSFVRPIAIFRGKLFLEFYLRHKDVDDRVCQFRLSLSQGEVVVAEADAFSQTRNHN